jgi:hypothetical protein
MQRHLDAVEIERQNNTHWGALEEHCDVIKLSILEVRGFESKYIIFKTWMHKLNCIS